MRAKMIRLVSMLITLLLCGLPLTAAGLEKRARTAGPADMEAMLATGASGEALDQVCGVRDCADIRLFWYTDLEAAKAAARASGKPILSLRLLGRLDEEFSCANSRFFRTVFYKNSEINKLLRDQFVLHWRSVRPVPKVTIEFGDGSRLERTLTGNSIHYVLDSRGRLVDALPGLYGPTTFQRSLQRAMRVADNARHLNDEQLATWMTMVHGQQLANHTEALRRDLAALPPATVPAETLARDPWAVLQEDSRVVRKDRDTGGKRQYEGPIMAALGEDISVEDDEISDLARLRRQRIRLDPASKTFLLRKQGVTDPKEAERLVDTFESTMALDEVINQYRMGPAILKKLSDRETLANLDLEAFNQWVYEEVFKTPLSDPWLGLAPDDVYTALPAATRTAARQPGR